ncbi:cyclase family protein [Leptobacterium sp. I13]|uniref:cyclase family protein n=1 Tax=Leptobacterium meishanense TaxID=3128904 RepID=UPI0030EF3EF9
MKTIIKHNNQQYEIDLSKPIDISIPIKGTQEHVTAWGLSAPAIDHIISVAKGGTVNFNTLHFNPHAHGTHTECVGHITETFHSVNQSLNKFFFIAEVVTVAPGKWGKDYVISKKQLENALKGQHPEAIIIRTLPNDPSKLSRNYSKTNPPYVLEEAAVFLRMLNIQHLLIDLPSVDKEEDDGRLLAHKAFWDVKKNVRTEATITELIYISNAVEDGTYLLNLQFAPIENDAAPSRPILYEIKAV